MDIKITKLNVSANHRILKAGWKFEDYPPQGIKITESIDIDWPFTVSFYGINYLDCISILGSFDRTHYKELSHKRYAFKFKKDITWLRLKWSNLINGT